VTNGVPSLPVTSPALNSGPLRGQRLHHPLAGAKVRPWPSCEPLCQRLSRHQINKARTDPSTEAMVQAAPSCRLPAVGLGRIVRCARPQPLREADNLSRARGPPDRDVRAEGGRERPPRCQRPTSRIRISAIAPPKPNTTTAAITQSPFQYTPVVSGSP
jgi:hypothetical protein